MADLVTRNRRLIEKSLNAVHKKEQEYAQKAMIKALKKAYDYISDIHHTAKHTFHLKVESGHVLLLLKNGAVVWEYRSKGKVPSEHAPEMISKAIASARKMGWVGVVLADMDSEVYQIQFERGVLTHGMSISGEYLKDKLEKMKI